MVLQKVLENFLKYICHYMSIKRYLLAGLIVGMLSLVYNYLAFTVLGIYPDLDFEISIFGVGSLDFYLFIFVKNFFVGLILMMLFSAGYRNISADMDEGSSVAKGIFFFILYGVFALVAFSFGDMILMRTQEGMLLLLTVDSVVETMIATVPIRLFYIKRVQ